MRGRGGVGLNAKVGGLELIDLEGLRVDDDSVIGTRTFNAGEVLPHVPQHAQP